MDIGSNLCVVTQINIAGGHHDTWPDNDELTVVWQTILNGPVSGRPITYSIDGRQYVAIGAGGLTQGTSFLTLTPELSTPSGSNTLFVFALPER